MRRSRASRSGECSNSSIAVRQAVSIACARLAMLTLRHEGDFGSFGHFASLGMRSV
jgi:hypothetical protein